MVINWLEEQSLLANIQSLYRSPPQLVMVSNENFKETVGEWFKKFLDWLKQLGDKIKEWLSHKNHTVISRIDGVIADLKNIKVDALEEPLVGMVSSQYLLVNGKQAIFENGRLTPTSFTRHDKSWRNYAISNGTSMLFGMRWFVNEELLKPGSVPWDSTVDDMFDDLKGLVKLQDGKLNPGGWYITGVDDILKIKVSSIDDYRQYLKTVRLLKVTHVNNPPHTPIKVSFTDKTAIKKNIQVLIDSLEFAKGLVERPSEYLARRDKLQRSLETTLNGRISEELDQRTITEYLNLIPNADEIGFHAIRFEQAILASVLRSMFDAAKVITSIK